MKSSTFYISAALIGLLTLGCSEKSESQINIGSTPVDTSTVKTGLDTPWEILWGPDDFIWFTERQGTVSRLNPANGQRTIILTVPDVFEYGEGGLLGMALHPDFSIQPYVYLVYNYTSGSSIKERLVRYTWNSSVLINQETLIEGISANSYHDGSRLVFGPDGKLYMSTGDAGNTGNSQNMNSLSGKILRINPDGSIPSDNPYTGSYIWSIGHRNAQGLTFSPGGILYSSEHGPDTDDELNIIESGRNYGWPEVAGFCDQSAELNFCNDNEVREPLVVWTPTLAVAGISYYGHPDIPEWQNSVLMTSLKAGKLVSLKLSSNGMSITEQADWFVNHFGRLRDICVSPDGRVFLAVSNRDGRGTPRPGDDRIVEIKATGSTGISGEPAGNDLMRIIPNPVDNEAIVYFSELIVNTQYYIINQLGMVIQSGQIDTPSLKLNVSNLDAGYYILKASGMKGSVSSPFIVR
ncbi:MAG: PQQ-dependent sugar dehydrogenase [Bacteroidota bacterium]